MISAALIKELRERTGVGMMECKKALEEAGGNLDEAIAIMRKSGKAKAAKKAGRIAAEGVVVIKVAEDHSRGFMVEVNCETDFASGDQDFVEFASSITQIGLAAEVTHLEELVALGYQNDQNIEVVRELLISRIGENITIRRVALIDSVGGNHVFSYVHGNGRIGVMIELDVDNPELGKDLAMHIAASRPFAIRADEIPGSLIEQEREVFLAQMQGTDKPQPIIDKIIAGKVQKFVDENTLYGQAFIKDPSIKVADLLKKSKAEVTRFVRFEVGEGIEKAANDFAAEVMAQVKK